MPEEKTGYSANPDFESTETNDQKINNSVTYPDGTTVSTSPGAVPSTFTDVAGSRSFGTQYTNDTGAPLTVIVQIKLGENLGSTNATTLWKVNYVMRRADFDSEPNIIIDQFQFNELELHTDGSGTSVDLDFVLKGVIPDGQDYEVLEASRDGPSVGYNWYEVEWS